MKKAFLSVLFLGFLAVSAFAQGGVPFILQEIDGSPKVQSPTVIKVSNGTLTCVQKVCTISTGGGGGGGTPGGLNTQVQFNQAGSFGGISGFTSDGTNVTAGSGNLRATRPRFITSIDDTNGNEVFVITATGSAVNEVTIANAATGNNPTFTASGGDANVGINFVPKGSGTIQVSGAAIVTVSATQTLTNKTLSTSNTVSAALTWTAGVKQTFAPDATTAGINVGSVAGDPSTPSNGDLWYDSSSNELTARINGANVALGSGGGSGANPTASVGLTAVNGVATTFMRSDAAPALDQAITPTWTGAHVWSLSSAAAISIGPNGNTNPAFRVITNVASAASGISITGRADGTAPTLQSLSRAQQAASIAGNGLEVRADDAVAGSSTAGAAAGGVLTLQSGAAARLTSGNANGGNINLVTGTGIGTGTAGQVVVPDGVAGAPGLTFSSSSGANGYGLRQVGGNQIYVSGGGVDVFGVISTGRVGVASTALFTFSSTTNAGGTAGITLRRAADANLAFGAADAASPVAQTLSVQNVVGGTTNTAGVNWTFAASRGTGTGAGGDIIFQTAPAGGSGTTQNTLATAFTIQDDGAVQLKSVTFANLPTVANGYLIYCSDCTIASPCASGGSGALAKGINGAWVCN